MSRGESAYRDFVEMHASRESDLQLFEIFSSPKYHGIECALWPSLYHTKTMCESVLEGSTSCESGKVAFMAKLLSPVAGYQLEYEQIHYQYDRWLFKTITGAINTARISNCSAATSLQHKTFSSGYWKWQHRIILDAVRFPHILLDNLAIRMVFSVASLARVASCRKWLCTNRVASNRNHPHSTCVKTIGLRRFEDTYADQTPTAGGMTDEGEGNLSTYFYRFEFQQRGTQSTSIC